MAIVQAIKIGSTTIGHMTIHCDNSSPEMRNLYQYTNFVDNNRINENCLCDGINSFHQQFGIS